MHRLLELLQGGDRRSIGRANEAAAEVLSNPGLFGVLIQGMTSTDPLIRMRAADAAEKVTAKRPELLAPHKRSLLLQTSQATQQEVRWHLALMLPRLELNARERKAAAAILQGWLDDRSRIIQVCALQGLAELSTADARLRTEVTSILKRLARTGSPAVRSRCAKLLATRS
jgi:hypothetical protein